MPGIRVIKRGGLQTPSFAAQRIDTIHCVRRQKSGRFSWVPPIFEKLLAFYKVLICGLIIQSMLMLLYFG